MALIDKETIRAEIERIMERAMNDVGRDVCQYILAFLDTLPEQEDILIINKKEWEAQEGFRKNKKFGQPLPEQPKLKPMNIPSAGGGMSTTPPSYKLDVKPKQLIGLDDENAADKKAVKEIVKTVHKEITRQVKEMLGRQPVEGLDAEMFKEWGTTKEEYLAKSMDKVHLEMEIATYLQDWEDDDEIGLHLSTDKGCMPIELEDVRDLARHFAEWGATHLKK